MRFASHARQLSAVPFAIITSSFLSTSELSALTIIRHFIGGQPPSTSIGGGTLVEVFDAAADRWEMAIRDDHTVVLHFGWATQGPGGTHALQAQGGTPNRETEGTILFDNAFPAPIVWFVDPTPYSNEEFQTFNEESQDLGGGSINVARYFRDTTPSFLGIDLMSVALHEIGHALGISISNISLIDEAVDGDVDVMLPRPFPGTVIPLDSNIFGVTSHIYDFTYGTLMKGVSGEERRLPSGIDVLVNAELSEFNDVVLDPPDPAPTAAGRIPSGDTEPGQTFEVSMNSSGDITLAWGASCNPGDSDYEVYEGVVGDFTSHSPVACSTGGLRTISFPPSPGPTYYLVVPRNALREGSYGVDSDGVERPPAQAACRPQFLSTSCL